MDDTFTDEDRRAFCIDHAILAQCGKSYNEDGNSIVDHDKIISAAKAFEDYLKGTSNV